jgi:hypothetical protein
MEKRRWVQFRLSTLVVVMVVASVLVYLNATGRPLVGQFGVHEIPSTTFFFWGWPYDFLLTHSSGRTFRLAGIVVGELNWLRLIEDVAIGVGIIIGAGGMAEFIARRRS